MVVAQLLFSSVSMAHVVHNGAGEGEMELFSIRLEYAEGIDRCQYGGADFRSEIVRLVMKVPLCKSQTQKLKASMPPIPASAQEVEQKFGTRKDQSEVRDLVPVLCCGEGDGGHRCPCFPCPHCHRNRSIFVPESRTQKKDSTASNPASAHEVQLEFGTRNDQSEVRDLVPVSEYGEGDGGHRCPYFPCPYCHRSRSICIPKTDYKESQTQKKDSMASKLLASAHEAYTEFSIRNDQSGVRDFVPVVSEYGEGDGGHRCPYFPCPYCHRSRSIFVPVQGCPDKGHTCPSFPCPICHRDR